MGYTDAKGRPELVVHPDIIGSRAVYRPADEEPSRPTRPVEQTPKQQARAELKRQIAQRRREQRKAGDTT
ncbi:hypothetical protein [Prescottella equi]